VKYSYTFTIRNAKFADECVCAAQYLCETQFFSQVHILFSLLYVCTTIPFNKHAQFTI